MATSPLGANPQRVALAKSADGRTVVYIEREWLRVLLGQGSGGGIGAGAISRAEFDALIARVAVLENAVEALQTAIAALQAAVDALENFEPNTVLYDDQGRALFDHLGRVLTSA